MLRQNGRSANWAARTRHNCAGGAALCGTCASALHHSLRPPSTAVSRGSASGVGKCPRRTLGTVSRAASGLLTPRDLRQN